MQASDSIRMQHRLLNRQLCIEPGKFIGIVGVGGSGKSTIMKLLPRLYKLEDGVIRIDDYDIQKVDLDSASTDRYRSTGFDALDGSVETTSL